MHRFLFITIVLFPVITFAAEESAVVQDFEFRLVPERCELSYRGPRYGGAVGLPLPLPCHFRKNGAGHVQSFPIRDQIILLVQSVERDKKAKTCVIQTAGVVIRGSSVSISKHFSEIPKCSPPKWDGKSVASFAE